MILKSCQSYNLEINNEENLEKYAGSHQHLITKSEKCYSLY